MLVNFFVLKSGHRSGDGLSIETAFRFPEQATSVAVPGDVVYLGPEWSHDRPYYASVCNCEWRDFREFEPKKEVVHEEVKAQGQGNEEGLLEQPQRTRPENLLKARKKKGY